MKKKISGCIVLALCCLMMVSCGENDGGAEAQNVVYVYNWGDYIDTDVLDQFEEETGIKVVYDEFETNESMYPKIASGTVKYDVIVPSDYMIAKMIDNDMLQKLDFDKLPNAKKYIGKKYYKQSEEFDPGNCYSVPYTWGVLGIMYNTKMVDEPVDSWSILWDPKYTDSVLMQDSVRDAFSVALKIKGYSLNTTDHNELIEARDLLIKQKPIVQAYVVDEAKDKMASGEAALGVVFSEEALLINAENPDLEFAVPKEGTNLWIDSMVIPKNAEYVDNAHKFIDFICRPDIALKIFDYLNYSTPNICVQEMEEDPELKNSKIAFPDDIYDDQETYDYLGSDMDRFYNELWLDLKTAD